MTVFDRIYNAALLPQIKTGSADDAVLAAKALLSGWEELSCEEPSREVKRAPQPVREAAKRSPASRAVKRFIGSILS